MVLTKCGSRLLVQAWTVRQPERQAEERAQRLVAHQETAERPRLHRDTPWCRERAPQVPAGEGLVPGADSVMVIVSAVALPCLLHQRTAALMR